MRHVFERSLRIPASAQRVFAWHEAPGALEKLIPLGDPVYLVEHTGGISNGARVVLKMGFGPLALRWVAIHQGYQRGVRFQDKQQSGPFHYWLHTHNFQSIGPGACVLHDHVEFELPFSLLADLALPIVLHKLNTTFDYRHRVTLAAFT